MMPAILGTQNIISMQVNSTRSFTTVNPEEFSTGSSQKRITTRTLCEITGTKYYLHN